MELEGQAPQSSVKKVNGMILSKMGLGTQRWVSTDYNAPDEAACVEVVDLAILKWLNSIRYQATVVHEHKKTIRNDSLASG